MWVKLPTEKNNRSREETNISSINIQWNLDITIQCTMKPLVEQNNDIIILNYMKITMIKKIKN